MTVLTLTPISNQPPAGDEYAYTEFTSNVVVSATTEAAANTIVTAPAVVFNGSTAVIIEFFAPDVQPISSVGGEVDLWLYDGSSSIGLLGAILNPAAAQTAVPFLIRRRLTPAAAAKTYSIRASRAGGNGTVIANSGGAGLFVPGYIRITRA